MFKIKKMWVKLKARVMSTFYDIKIFQKGGY